MEQRNDIELSGCSTEPMISYLKALGIFRIVAEQKDPELQGYWRSGLFCLRTKLDQQELIEHFLDDYSPTPLIAPWNGSSGFYPKDNAEAITAIENSTSLRLGDYRKVIALGRKLVRDLNLKHQPDKEEKVALLRFCRNEMPDRVLPWLDSVFAVTGDDVKFSPLLGSGGNDGHLEFSSNFMQRLVQILPSVGQAATVTRSWLLDALFSEGKVALESASVGLFHPGGVGGPNSTQGFEGKSFVNPWSYVLMMEGLLMFAGGMSRRLDFRSDGYGVAAFPFMVRASAAGWGSVSGLDSGEPPKGELWLPVWRNPANIREVTYLFSEGRADLGRNRVSNGMDFARAAVSLGVDRGLSSFTRFGFFKRSGRSYLAVPIGDFPVIRRAEGDLVSDISRWLGSLRRAFGTSRAKAAPQGISSSLRGIEDAVFNLCQKGGAGRAQEMLIAIGETELEVARSSHLRQQVSPLQGLSKGWVRDAYDGSVEFRLASSLASIWHQSAGSIRSNLEPVVQKRKVVVWADDSPSHVWTMEPLISNMIKVLNRRLVEGQIGTPSCVPLGGHVPASLKDIDSFIRGETDDDRIGRLLPGLACIRWQESEIRWDHSAPAATLTRAYALIKPLFIPQELKRGASVLKPRPELGILARLRSGDTGEACSLASRRYVGSGMKPMGEDAVVSRAQVRRLVASLLFPVRYIDVMRLADMVLRPSAELSETR